MMPSLPIVARCSAWAALLLGNVVVAAGRNWGDDPCVVNPAVLYGAFSRRPGDSRG